MRWYLKHAFLLLLYQESALQLHESNDDVIIAVATSVHFSNSSILLNFYREKFGNFSWQYFAQKGFANFVAICYRINTTWCPSMIQSLPTTWCRLVLSLSTCYLMHLIPMVQFKHTINDNICYICYRSVHALNPWCSSIMYAAYVIDQRCKQHLKLSAIHLRKGNYARKFWAILGKKCCKILTPFFCEKTILRIRCKSFSNKYNIVSMNDAIDKSHVIYCWISI